MHPFVGAGLSVLGKVYNERDQLPRDGHVLLGHRWEDGAEHVPHQQHVCPVCGRPVVQIERLIQQGGNHQMDLRRKQLVTISHWW